MTPDEIRQLRKVLKITQRQLADKLKITTKTVAAWEQGTHRPKPVMIRKLKRMLK